MRTSEGTRQKQTEFHESHHKIFLTQAVESLSKKFHIHRNSPRTLKEAITRKLTRRQASSDENLWALRDVSFEVPSGETLGVIGHNGAGKSTLLRLLCGIGLPTSGVIRRSGSVDGVLELGTGFHPLLTGRENIRTAGILNGLTRRQFESVEKEMIAFAELEDFIDEPVRTYSSGMSLRLAFAAAVQMDPDILMIDEVLSVGDEGFRKKCLARLREFQRAGKTLIIASHELDQIQVMCDEILVLEDGRAVFKSKPADAIKHYHDLLRQRTDRRAARLSDAPQAMIQEPGEGKRMGTQEATITAVRLYDETGAGAESLADGTALTIEMDVKFMKPLPDFALTLGIFTEADVKCFETCIPSAKSLLGSNSGDVRFRCRVPALPLLAGRYFVNIGLFPIDYEFMYDYHWQMHSFHVVGTIPNVSGILSIHPKWSAES